MSKINIINQRCLYPNSGLDFKATLKLPFIKEWIYVDKRDDKIKVEEAAEEYGFKFLSDHTQLSTIKFKKGDVTLYFVYNTILPALDNPFLKNLLCNTGYIFSQNVPNFNISEVTPKIHTLFIDNPLLPEGVKMFLVEDYNQAESSKGQWTDMVFNTLLGADGNDSNIKRYTRSRRSKPRRSLKKKKNKSRKRSPKRK